MNAQAPGFPIFVGVNHSNFNSLVCDLRGFDISYGHGG